MATAVPPIPSPYQGNLLQGTGALISPTATIGVKASSPTPTAPTNTIPSTMQAPTGFTGTATQKQQLDANYARLAAAPVGSTDYNNLQYAIKNLGYKAPTSAVSPSTAAPTTTLKPATTGPTPAASGTNTLKAYDQNGNVVYVTPGTYNPGISLTPKTTTSGSLPGLNGAPSAQSTQSTTGPGQQPVSSGISNIGANSTTDQLNQGGVYGQLIAALLAKSGAPNADYTNSQTALTGAGTQLQTLASTSSPEYQAQLASANQYNQQLQDLRSQEAQALANNSSNPIPLEFQQGRGQILQNLYGQREQALGSAFQGASTLVGATTAQQAAQQQGLASAGGLFGQAIGAANNQQGIQTAGLLGTAGATAPVQVPYNNQFISPVNGQGISGGTVGQLPQQAMDIVNTYAQQVQNGQMTRADAESRLAPYGVAGTNALTQALGSGFNTNLSNASAATTASGQQLQTQATSAVQALDTLQAKFNQLSGLETGGIPASNAITQWIGSALGQGSLTQYNQTLSDARQQLEGVLAAAGGGTPTNYVNTAQTYLPDNMTPAMLSQAISNVKALIQQKVSSFVQSGQQSPTQSTGTPGQTNWSW